MLLALKLHEHSELVFILLFVDGVRVMCLQQEREEPKDNGTHSALCPQQLFFSTWLYVLFIEFR